MWPRADRSFVTWAKNRISPLDNWLEQMALSNVYNRSVKNFFELFIEIKLEPRFLSINQQTDFHRQGRFRFDARRSKCKEFLFFVSKRFFLSVRSENKQETFSGRFFVGQRHLDQIVRRTKFSLVDLSFLVHVAEIDDRKVFSIQRTDSRTKDSFLWFRNILIRFQSNETFSFEHFYIGPPCPANCYGQGRCFLENNEPVCQCDDNETASKITNKENYFKTNFLLEHSV